MTLPNLPVGEVLDNLKQSLSERDEVVLQAPPGAGKTTVVPLALLAEPWLGGKKILVLEPRRIATKSAAHRMASLINESPGQTVGYRMRLDRKTGKDTRIEIITDGILTRMLQQDPSLEQVGLVIFDEFHERNLESDLALSLCLKGRSLFRDTEEPGNHPLKILVMSATLDSEAIARLLDDAPVVKSEGRTFPVDIIYGQASQPREPVVKRMVHTIQRVLLENPDSSILAFLPGQGEIHRTNEALSSWLVERKLPGIHLRPLFGNLTIEEQQMAIAPLTGKQAGEQKVVLATNIAETSLTIEGIDIVVDSGLAREPRFNPATGMTGLHTVKISAASSIQRAGRAGRLKAGKCYRLWSETQQQQLAPHSKAEILTADLAPLALQLLQWGIDNPAELLWLDPPPIAPWQQALDLLDLLGAIELKAEGRVLTSHGQAMVTLPVHPRLAHMLLMGADAGLGKSATLLAGLLSERNPLSQSNPDIGYHLDILTDEISCPSEHRAWRHRILQLARQLEEAIDKQLKSKSTEAAPITAEQAPGYLLACAYPDRIARRRHSGGYQLANGRGAGLAEAHQLGNNRWLAIAEVGGIAGGKGDSIRSAAHLDEALFSSLLIDNVHLETIAEWDRKSSRFVAEEQQKIGALVLSRKSLQSVPTAAKTAALVQYVQKQGLELLPWTTELEQWCARVSLVRSIESNAGWPDVSHETLLATIKDWLAPYLDEINLLKDFKKLDLKNILTNLLPWEKQQQLEQLAPRKLLVPSGSSITINYLETPPVLAAKLQEMFGCEQSPTLVNGKVAVVVHLLSPAGRPLQITQDLAGFWRSSYHDVKKEMKGRYPKHPWPDDPLNATPTRRTRPRKQ